MSMETVTGGVQHLSEADVTALIATADRPILLDAYADWCGPCRMLAPQLEAAARELGDRVHVVKVNVDEAPRLSAALGVRSIPALFVIRGESVVDGWLGYTEAAAITARVEAHLAS